MDKRDGEILVIGMHRSGTSALSGLLVKMGAYFGPDDQKLPEKKANPKGYWERWDVVLANDRLLARHGLAWDRIASWRYDLFDGDAETAGREELASVAADYQQHRPWFAKDPRLCLTLPCWRPLLDNPVCIFMLRDPLQVAMSLASRGDSSPAAGLALWEAYTGAALYHTRGMPRHIIEYDDLLRDPAAELRRLHGFLEANGVSGLHVPADDEIGGWLDRGLRREQLRVEDMPDVLNAPQRELFERLRDRSAFQADAAPHALSGGAMLALRNHEELHCSMVDELKALRKNVAEMEVELGLVRVYKADIAKWTADLEAAADAMERSMTWKVNRALLPVIGKSSVPTPLDRIRDIIAAQKNLHGLGEPEQDA